jgi:uncharacterized protein with ParB-like and HNH nuclease domain
VADGFASYPTNITNLLGRTAFSDSTVRNLKVPQYQRPYSWTTQHVSTFWQDIKDYDKTGGKQNYFLGPIVILPEKDCISLLDGQQRLATITILISLIRDIILKIGTDEDKNEYRNLSRDIHRDYILLDGSDEDIFSLELGELDREFFRDYVQKAKPNDDEKSFVYSHKTIKSAKNDLRKRLLEELEKFGKSEKKVSYLNELRKTLTLKLSVVVIKVTSEEEAFLIFETLNDRGLRLQVPDLVLNFMMRKATNQANRKTIRNHWDSTVSILEDRRLSTFLRHFWISQHGDVKTRSLFPEIKEYINDGHIKPENFAKECKLDAVKYIEIINGKSGTKTLNFLPNILKYFNADKCLPALLSLNNALDKKHYQKTGSSIVNFYIIHDVLAQANPAVSEELFFKIASEVTKMKQKKGSSSDISKYVKQEIKNKFPAETSIQTGGASLTLSREQARVILYFLANYKKQGKANIIDFDNFTVEHIFPQQAKAANWANKKDLDEYVWNLGNLVPLEEGLNKDADTLSFSDKLEVYKKSNIEAAKEIPEKYKSWNVDTITSRGTGMANALVKALPI